MNRASKKFKQGQMFCLGINELVYKEITDVYSVINHFILRTTHSALFLQLLDDKPSNCETSILCASLVTLCGVMLV